MWMLFSQFSHFALERIAFSMALPKSNQYWGGQGAEGEGQRNHLIFQLFNIWECALLLNNFFLLDMPFHLFCPYRNKKGVFLYLLKMNLDFNLTFAASAHLGLKASNFDAEKCGKMGLWCGKWPPNRRPNSRANSSVISTKTRHATLCPQISVFLLENE